MENQGSSQKFASYSQAMEYLEQSYRKGKKDGLRGMAYLMEQLGNPQKQLRFVHVTGTNGKGSTCMLVAAALERAGYRVGLFISPHVDDFRERIQVNRTYISEKEFTQVYGEVVAAGEKREAEGYPFPSEFEQITAAALSYFAQKKCQIVVLEVGIGGAKDATNIIPAPEAAVFTPISLDHISMLGETTGEIAKEKSGIIKPGCCVVICPGQDQQAAAVLKEAASRQEAPVVEAPWPEECSCTASGVTVTAGGQQYTVPLAGDYQVQNAATALAVLNALNQRMWKISPKNIREGFANVAFQGRLEIISQEPLVILDGSHNPAGVRCLMQYVQEHLKGQDVTVVLGMLKDKSHKECIPIIASAASRLITVGINDVRGLSGEEIAAEAAGWCSNITPCTTVREGVLLALREQAGPVLICGSLYLPGEARYAYWEYKQCRDMWEKE